MDPIDDHSCGFPWTGSLQQCIECGKWWQVVVYKDEITGLTWKSWEPVDNGRD